MSLDRWIGFESLGDWHFRSARMMAATKRSKRLLRIAFERRRPEEKVRGKPSHRSWVPGVSASSLRMTRANLATLGLNRQEILYWHRWAHLTCFLCSGCWRGSGQWRTAVLLLGVPGTHYPPPKKNGNRRKIHSWKRHNSLFLIGTVWICNQKLKLVYPWEKAEENKSRVSASASKCGITYLKTTGDCRWGANRKWNWEEGSGGSQFSGAPFHFAFL